jgi:hypothetical protein
MTEPAPARPRRLPPLWAGLLALLLGCNSLSLHLLSRGKPDDKPDPAAAPEQANAAPGRFSQRVAPYVFLADFDLKKDAQVQALLQELAGLRDQVYRELALPPGSAVVQVYLFEDRPRYERFLRERHPELPPRRAFFVAQPRGLSGAEDLYVYTFLSDRLQQDLRHELTHALLHSSLRDVPLWLDEGLAEFFELPPERQGVNADHVRVLGNGGFRPDLARLEGLKEVRDMRQPEYREAWAWAHFMLRGRPEARAVLLAYLRDLRASPSPAPLGPRLAQAVPELDDALQRHLAQVEAVQAASR